MDEALDFDNSDKILRLIVDRGELPQFIYKYVDIETAKRILENSTLKFSKPSEFNDPFDCNLTIDTNNSQEEIEAYISLVKRSKNLNDEQVKELRRSFHSPKKLHAITNQSISDAKETFGVTCFSKNPDSILMWSHYADKHRGACLKLNILADAEFFMTPFPVKYKKKYPKYNYIRNREGTAKFLLETKSIDWKYENEIRVMKRGANLYNFKKEALCGIIFGANTSIADKEAIMDLVDKLNYDAVLFRSAKISKKKFKVNIKKS